MYMVIKMKILDELKVIPNNIDLFYTREFNTFYKQK